MFEGNIAAGKSTLVSRLAADEPERYVCAPEAIGASFLAAFYKQPQRYGFALQMTQQAHRAALLDAALASTSPTRTMLLDRSILGDYAFALWNAAIGNLDAEQWALYQEQAGSSIAACLQRCPPDEVSIVFLYDTASECQARQAERDSTAVDAAYMLGLESAHFVVLACVPTTYKLIELQWSEYANQAAAPTVFDALLDGDGDGDDDDDVEEPPRARLAVRARSSISQHVFNADARAFLLDALTSLC